MTRPRIAVVGAGWAGLAAAVRLTASGRPVTLYEMAPRAGGRARRVEQAGWTLDNGQHILIGAYTATLALMRAVGVDPDTVLHRTPLTLQYADGRGLRLPAGAAVPAFVRGVLACRSWTWAERIALLGAAARWRLNGFRCNETLTVDGLCATLPGRVRQDLIDPLCVAALNTPAQDASAAVLLRVLRDALFSGAGAADLLLPRAPLDELLPAPAVGWLGAAGAEIRTGRRVQVVAPAGAGWTVDGEAFAQVVLACSAGEAARLAQPLDAAWADQARSLKYEPIMTVYLDAPGLRLPLPMMALDAGPQAPAQFVFDHGALGGRAGLLACAISGAAPWVERGADATAQATLAQLRAAFAGWPPAAEVVRVLAEKRATFRCTPGLQRPPGAIGPGLHAAGDYVAGPYPATLEGAVRSGVEAANAVLAG